MKCKQQQQGAVLVVSLLILVVLTIIGLSGLTNTSMEERMSHNFQHAMLAFQGAESANEAIIEMGNPDNTSYGQGADGDPLLTALNAGQDDTSTTVTQDMDPHGYLESATLDTTSTVSYKGTLGDLCAGESQVKCYRFELDTVASIDASGTRTEHIQGIERLSPDPGT